MTTPKSSETVDVKSLSAEERAIVDRIAWKYLDEDYDALGHDPSGRFGAFGMAFDKATPIILARRQILAAANKATAESPATGAKVRAEHGGRP
jgi:hypothetical protein